MMMIRSSVPFLFLTAAVVLVSAGASQAQWPNRGVRNLGGVQMGVRGMPYGSGQQYYSSQPYTTQSYYYGNGYNGFSPSNPLGSLLNGLLSTQPGYSTSAYYPAFQLPYSTNSTYYGNQQYGYRGIVNSPTTSPHYYYSAPGGQLVPATYYYR
jgi:hypothetical protein